MVELINLLESSQVKWIIILIAVDVVLGIIAALKKNEFRLGKLANFMFKPVLGYVLGFSVLQMAAEVLPELAFVARISYFLIILALVGSVLNNLGRMGASIPPYLKKD